jgi:hypothetical protein
MGERYTGEDEYGRARRIAPGSSRGAPAQADVGRAAQVGYGLLTDVIKGFNPQTMAKNHVRALQGDPEMSNFERVLSLFPGAEFLGAGLLAKGPAGALRSGALRSASPEDALVAHHNTSAQGLLAADELGGIPMPSIAISKAEDPLSRFGDISLLLNKEAVTPSRAMRVFNSDIYSGRQPRPKVNLLSPEDAAKQFLEDPMFKHLDKDEVLNQFRMVNDGGSQDRLFSLENAIRGIQYQVQNKALNPKKFKTLEALIREARQLPYDSKIETMPGLRNPELAKTYPPVGDSYTRNGNPRNEVPYTLENALRHMRKDRAFEPGSETTSLSPGSARALAARRFRNLREISNARGQIVGASREDFKDDFYQRYANVSGDIGDASGLGERQGEHLIDAVARGDLRYLPDGLATPENVAAARGLLAEARNLPTGYFEAKPRRALGLDEFSGAVVPEGVSEEVLRALARHRVPVATRKASDPAGPYSDDFRGLLFSAPPIPISPAMIPQPDTEEPRFGVRPNEA